MELLIGTTNRGKFAEIRALMGELPMRLVPLASLAGRPEIAEDQDSFEGNALKKARALAEFSGRLTLADDSGLEVDALGGAPGVYSARYAGADSGDARNNEKLLLALEGVPPESRAARFVCVLALCAPRSMGGGERLIREECRGLIAAAPRGGNGFGYDPLFYYPPLGKTFAEIDRGSKMAVSHRGKALARLAEILRTLAAAENEP